MNRYMVRHIFWIIFGGMVCWLASCNNNNVSEKQAESFMKYYAVDADNNSGTVVIEASDGGYAIMCNIESESGHKDIILIFTDEFGRQKSDSPVVIGSTTSDDHGYCMISLDDGYLIAGVSGNAPSKQGYLVNVSNDGTIIWEQKYDGYQELEFRDAYLDPDGNLVVTGYLRNNSGDDAEVILFKIASQGGEIRWRRSWGWAGQDYIGDAVIQFQQRYHIISTAADVNRPKLTSIRMINTNLDGKGESSSPIKKDYLSGKDITVNPAGHMYILGNQENPASRKSRIFLAELELTQANQVTNIKDSVTIQDLESMYGTSFAPVRDDALAIGGREGDQTDTEILFLEVDTNFPNVGILNHKTYGSQGYQDSQHIIYTLSDNGAEGFVLTGSANLAGARTSILLKLDSEGELR